MIVVYMLMTVHWSAQFADAESCQRAHAAFNVTKTVPCVQVLVPAPSDKAYHFMPNRIAK